MRLTTLNQMKLIILQSIDESYIELRSGNGQYGERAMGFFGSNKVNNTVTLEDLGAGNYHLGIKRNFGTRGDGRQHLKAFLAGLVIVSTTETLFEFMATSDSYTKGNNFRRVIHIALAHSTEVELKDGTYVNTAVQVGNTAANNTAAKNELAFIGQLILKEQTHNLSDVEHNAQQYLYGQDRTVIAGDGSKYNRVEASKSTPIKKIVAQAINELSDGFNDAPVYIFV